MPGTFFANEVALEFLGSEDLGHAAYVLRMKSVSLGAAAADITLGRVGSRIDAAGPANASVEADMRYAMARARNYLVLRQKASMSCDRRGSKRQLLPC